MLKALLQEISENYLGVTPIQSGDSVIINERSVISMIETGKQGGTALTRPMHYRNVVHGIFCTGALIGNRSTEMTDALRG